ncbi:MAG TPA: T9SS type A sorting domain-containing protein [Fluviicola sp.]|nr:T9SS type A sorting domain-containing protein [Fluviicola sp.]
MRTIVTQFFKNCTIVAFLAVTVSANAATYTAVSSGLWSNGSIWADGVSPGGSVGFLDNVVINAGVNVTLDMDVEFTGLLTSLQVNGSLESSSSAYMLDMTSGVISGTGSMTLHNLRFGSVATMTFTGDASVDKLWNNAVALDLSGDMEVNDTLFLDAGSMNLSSGSLTFMSSAVIRVDNGTMSVSGGALNNSNDYSVRYVGTDKTAGIELAGSGLSDVWIDLDNNSQELSVSGNMTIEGVVHHDQGMINLNGGTLTLMGDYVRTAGANFVGSAASSLAIRSNASLSSSLVFDADYDQLNDLTIDMADNNASTNIGSDLTINGALMLEDGDFYMSSGTLMMENGSEIIVTDGHLMSSGGTFDGDNSYSVTYNGTASGTSGIELTGAGLNNLTIDMDNQSDAIDMDNDLTIDGSLNLDNGGLELNGYDLTLDGSLSSTMQGWFGGHEDSDIEFNTASLVGDTVWFSSGSNIFGDFIINATDGSDLVIGNNVEVDNLTMTTGGVHIRDNELRISSTGMITGADENRYVLINGTGGLVQNIPVSGPYTMFPVGTDEGYAPLGLQQNSGTAGYFKVHSHNLVWSNGTSGIDYAEEQAVVSRSWNVESEGGGSLNLNVMAQWQDDFEVNSFDRNDAYIMHYDNGSWDAASQAPAAADQVGGLYRLERENVTSDGPFAVGTGEDLNIDENGLIVADIYPNPVQTILTSEATFSEVTTAAVVDALGNVLYSANVLGNHSFDFTNYPNGVYFVKYSNSTGTSSYRVVKSAL